MNASRLYVPERSVLVDAILFSAVVTTEKAIIDITLVHIDPLKTLHELVRCFEDGLIRVRISWRTKTGVLRTLSSGPEGHEDGFLFDRRK